MRVQFKIGEKTFATIQSQMLAKRREGTKETTLYFDIHSGFFLVDIDREEQEMYCCDLAWDDARSHYEEADEQICSSEEFERFVDRALEMRA